MVLLQERKPVQDDFRTIVKRVVHLCWWLLRKREQELLTSLLQASHVRRSSNSEDRAQSKQKNHKPEEAGCGYPLTNKLIARARIRAAFAFSAQRNCSHPR